MNDTTDIKRQFFNSLKLGTGEAYLIAKNNPHIDFSNQIIKGVLNIYAYDGQSEGNRAQYIFDTISTSKLPNKELEQCCIALIKVHLAYRSDIHNLYRQLRLFEQADAEQIFTRVSSFMKLTEIMCRDKIKSLATIAESYIQLKKESVNEYWNFWSKLFNYSQ